MLCFILINLVVSYNILLSQQHNDQVYLKNGKVINGNVLGTEFRSIKVNSNEVKYINIGVIDSIYTENFEFCDSLSKKYESVIIHEKGNYYLIVINNAKLEEGWIQSSTGYYQKNNIVIVFISGNGSISFSNRIFSS